MLVEPYRNGIAVFIRRYLVYSRHYDDVVMGAIASQITSLTIVYLTVCLDADQRKHQSSASLAFVWGIHWGPVNSPYKWPVTRKMSPFDDVIMVTKQPHVDQHSTVTWWLIFLAYVLMGSWTPSWNFTLVHLGARKIAILFGIFQWIISLDLSDRLGDLCMMTSWHENAVLIIPLLIIT